MTVLALFDLNAAYASMETIFQPELRGKPVIVLSMNDGCIVARSQQAKALGIAMGEPWHLARDRYEGAGVIVRSSNLSLYGDLSQRVMSILRDLAPAIDVYSIDEAFLALDGIADVEAHARTIRDRVRKWTGLASCVGISTSKTLAKAANRLAKKGGGRDGVMLLLDEESQAKALASMELTDIWGVAERMAARLRSLGIMTPLQLRSADPRQLRDRIGVVAERLAYEIRGRACLAFDDTPVHRSIAVCRSFGRPVMTITEAREAVASYLMQATAKLRRHGLAAGHLQVSLETNPFKADEPQRHVSATASLPVATADTGRLASEASRLLDTLWRPGFRYKRAGVMLLDLVPADRVGSSLFDRPDSEASIARMRAMDVLNLRFGRGTVAIGASLPSGRPSREGRPAWSVRSRHLSRRFTTRWDELLEV